MLQSGRLALSGQAEMLLFLAFFIAFAIKVPLFPLHTWLPDAHVEAPTAGSIMLASVMLKMGTYGLVRFCLPLFPNAAHKSAPWIIGLAVIGIIYGRSGRIGAAQHEEAGGVFVGQPPGVRRTRRVFVHTAGARRRGLSDAEPRYLDRRVVPVGWLSLRTAPLHIEISAYGGVATPAPNLAIVFLIATLASIGLRC